MRDDEEQATKLDSTVELLLAAGYFRARIKGLSPFDKVSQVLGIGAIGSTFHPSCFRHGRC